MKRWIPIIASLAMLLIGAVVLNSAATADTSEAEVHITSEGLVPSVITITIGTTVTWFNDTEEEVQIRSGLLHTLFLPLVIRNSGSDERVAGCDECCYSCGYTCAPGLECIQVKPLLGGDKCRNPACPLEESCCCGGPCAETWHCNTAEGSICWDGGDCEPPGCPAGEVCDPETCECTPCPGCVAGPYKFTDVWRGDGAYDLLVEWDAAPGAEGYSIWRCTWRQSCGRNIWDQPLVCCDGAATQLVVSTSNVLTDTNEGVGFPPGSWAAYKIIPFREFCPSQFCSYTMDSHRLPGWRIYIPITLR